MQQANIQLKQLQNLHKLQCNKVELTCILYKSIIQITQKHTSRNWGKKNATFTYIATTTKHLAALLIYLLAYKLQHELKTMCNNT
jgi:hypothetical protein